MSSPDLSAAERQAVADVLATPILSIGSQIKAFEDTFRERLGIAHAIGVNSGTAGLHLCVRAAGIRDGDLVLTSPFSFVSSSNVILYERAIPVYVDVMPDTGNMDGEQVRQALKDLMEGGNAAKRWLPRRGVPVNAHLKAVLSVDVFGQPADADVIFEAARSYGLPLIEDACEALGAEYKSRPTGLLGDLAVFAFYPNKQITTGEGGMIVTEDEKAADFMRALRNQGRAPGDIWLQHSYLGYNYRLDEMGAALGRVQMGRLDALMAKRQQVADWYAARLAKIKGVQPPIIAPTTTRPSWFVYVVRFDKGIERERVVKVLEKRGIPARPYFLPIHLQQYMREAFNYRNGDFPVTEDLGRRGLALPFSSVMTEEQVDEVCQALRAAL
jgi:perosamine synthetase